MKFISIPKDMAMLKMIAINNNKNFILNICLSKTSSGKEHPAPAIKKLIITP